MPRQSSRLGTIIATAALVLPLVSGCEAKVYGTPPAAPEAPNLTVTAPQGSLAPLPEVPPGQPAASFDGLNLRMQQATDAAARAGADITVQVLDRNTGRTVSGGNESTIATASVAKVFIADDLLLRESRGEEELSAEDRAAVETMLRSSDDSAAEIFWGRGGGNSVITRIADRYGLESTRPPGNGRWWNTISTAADLVRYYDMLITGAGGLPPDRAAIILSDMAQSTPTGLDGYPQGFGIPDGLYNSQVAVKQGWMCCIGSDWMHLSSGFIGADQRFVLAIGSMQAADPAAARSTITEAVKTIFPGGRI